MPGKQEEAKLLCENCQSQLNALIDKSLMSEKELTILRHPRRIHQVTFPLKRDNGDVEMVSGFRVQYNDALGPTKGGIRIHHEANLEEVTELAFLMALKCSLVGLPYGGGKGAIQINPRELSETEYEMLVRTFGQQIAHFIGPDYDIPAPDVNTNADTMMLMLEEYERTVGHAAPATFTGKPFAKGGSLGRKTSTSKGGFHIIMEMLKNKNPKETTVAIQGFGNVGGHLAEFLHKAEYKIVAVSDSSAGLYNEEGLDIPALVQFKKTGDLTGANKKELLFKNYDYANKIDNNAVLSLDVDMLIPAALGGVITKDNAKNIQAPFIVEMANAPVTPEADDVLEKKGTIIVPDILANAGGVIVSYFEWMQNKKEEQWTSEKVEEKLRDTMITAYTAMRKEGDLRPNVDLRTICYLLAVRRILEAEKAIL